MKALIAFFDEAGVSDRPTVRRTWSKRGITPIITSAGGWKTRSVMGATVAEADGTSPRLYVMVRKAAVRSEDVILFLRNLKRHAHGRRVLLLWDSLRAHTSKRTTAYIRTQAHWLRVERFPAYAPELNPQEYVWSSGRTKDWANAAPATLSKLDRNIHRGLRRIGRSTSVLRGCLRASGLFKDI